MGFRWISGYTYKRVISPILPLDGAHPRSPVSKQKPASGASYEADSIQVLEGLEAVRRRPAMYIGSTGPRGLHHLIWEVVDNSVDEAMAGYCTRIDVTLLADGGVRVRDNGRGIPVDKHKKTGLSALTTVMTTLHAGGKFDSDAYQVSGGLHGVGISVVNALSVRTDVEVVRNGNLFVQSFAYGEPIEKLKKSKPMKRSGTQVTFWADPDIFEDNVSYSARTVLNRLREMAFLTRGLEIRFRDEREDEVVEEAFRYAGGIVDFVKYLNGTAHGKRSTNRLRISSIRTVTPRWRSRCNGLRATPSRFFRSRTTSTRMRGGRTRRVSGRRSRVR